MDCIDEIIIYPNKNITVKWAIVPQLSNDAKPSPLNRRIYVLFFQNMHFNSHRDVEKMSRIIYNIRDIQWEVVLWIADI